MDFRRVILDEKKLSFRDFFHLKPSKGSRMNHCEEIDVREILKDDPELVSHLIKYNVISSSDKFKLQEDLEHFFKKGDKGYGGVDNIFDARAFKITLEPDNLDALEAAFKGFCPVYDDIVRVSNKYCLYIDKSIEGVIKILGKDNIVLKFKEYIDNFLKNYKKNNQ